MKRRKDRSTDHLASYEQWIHQHPHAVRELQSEITDALDDAGLAYDQVSVRVKARSSFLAKLANPDYPHYEDINTAHDILGVRVTTYNSSAIPQLVDVITGMFPVQRMEDKTAQTAQSGGFGYASQHIIVRSEKLGGALVEIQLRTVLQHAWAEFEHDVRYKNGGAGANPEVDRAFTLAAGLIELADQQFDKIAAITAEESERAAETEITAAGLPGELSRLLGPGYPTSNVDYYTWAVDMLAAHGITTHGELCQLLAPEAIAELNAVMAYPYRPGQVRFLDDMLLFTYGRDHIRRTVRIGDNTATRPGRLGNRWQKLGQRTRSERTAERSAD
ncbi:GTP pyrophosphokinase [Corynebacterium heidelbergense]|uniref:RelA/SpoT domain-containing protein n=1 Tax=Corynebacterium heidelbergense TaxID=2055947 RepID=A0A364V9X9_9CORY|nr:hypothetical protein [Corynebacterium heidelbergense]RAV33445.1 hypothetical protein CWC39_08445 [Corynebacterium heidelbergense]WCZ36396.1 GTP pyrophosphokinase YjbM [Corynebacterium heidelbergense]